MPNARTISFGNVLLHLVPWPFLARAGFSDREQIRTAEVSYGIGPVLCDRFRHDLCNIPSAVGLFISFLQWSAHIRSLGDLDRPSLRDFCFLCRHGRAWHRENTDRRQLCRRPISLVPGGSRECRSLKPLTLVSGVLSVIAWLRQSSCRLVHDLQECISRVR